MSEQVEALLVRGYRYALALCHDRAEAEDLLQDGWVSLLSARGPRTAPYLLRAIRTRFIDRHRRARLVSIEPLPPESLARFEDVEGQLPDPLPAPELERALGALRVEEREALVLHFALGCTAAEIAALTDRPRGTVLSLLHRGRGKLAALLAADEEETGS